MAAAEKTQVKKAAAKKLKAKVMAVKKSSDRKTTHKFEVATVTDSVVRNMTASTMVYSKTADRRVTTDVAAPGKVTMFTSNLMVGNTAVDEKKVEIATVTDIMPRLIAENIVVD